MQNGCCSICILGRSDVAYSRRERRCKLFFFPSVGQENIIKPLENNTPQEGLRASWQQFIANTSVLRKPTVQKLTFAQVLYHSVKGSPPPPPCAHPSGHCQSPWLSDAAVFLETRTSIKQDPSVSTRVLGKQLSFFSLSQLCSNKHERERKNGKRERITVKSTASLWTDTGTLEKSHASFLKHIRRILQKWNGRKTLLPDLKCLPRVMSINNISRSYRYSRYLKGRTILLRSKVC